MKTPAMLMTLLFCLLLLLQAKADNCDKELKTAAKVLKKACKHNGDLDDCTLVLVCARAAGCLTAKSLAKACDPPTRKQCSKAIRDLMRVCNAGGWFKTFLVVGGAFLLLLVAVGANAN